METCLGEPYEFAWREPHAVHVAVLVAERRLEHGWIVAR